MVEPRCSNIRIITALFLVSKYLGILQYTNHFWEKYETEGLTTSYIYIIYKL